MDRFVDAVRNLDRQPESFSRPYGNGSMPSEDPRYGGRQEPMSMYGSQYELPPSMGTYGSGGGRCVTQLFGEQEYSECISYTRLLEQPSVKLVLLCIQILCTLRYVSGPSLPYGARVREIPGFYSREEFEGGGRARRFSDILGSEPPSGNFFFCKRCVRVLEATENRMAVHSRSLSVRYRITVDMPTCFVCTHSLYVHAHILTAHRSTVDMPTCITTSYCSYMYTQKDDSHIHVCLHNKSAQTNTVLVRIF
jgi:hypothetical protein